MNAARRKALGEIRDRIVGLQSEIETCQAQEEEYYDAMPESFQNGSKGEVAQAAIYGCRRQSTPWKRSCPA